MGKSATALFLAAPTATLGTAGAAAPTYFQYQAVRAQEEARKEQRRAAAIEQRKADIAAYRERIATIREARARRGETLQAAQTQGVSESSGAKGAVSSIASQLGANLSFLDVTQELSKQESIFRQKAADWQTKATTSAAKGEMASSLFSSGTKLIGL